MSVWHMAASGYFPRMYILYLRHEGAILVTPDIIRMLYDVYCIRGNFRGMEFSLYRKQTGFSWLYFCGSQVHRGKVACYVLLQISNCCKIANFHGLNFHCISSDREIHKIYIPRKFLCVRYYKLGWVLQCTISSLHVDWTTVDRERFAGLNICGSSAIEVFVEILLHCLGLKQCISIQYLV